MGLFNDRWKRVYAAGLLSIVLGGASIETEDRSVRDGSSTCLTHSRNSNGVLKEGLGLMVFGSGLCFYSAGKQAREYDKKYGGKPNVSI